jgi:hypothetical protein
MINKRCKGAAMIEYIVVAAALAAALLTPLNDDYVPAAQGKNIVERLVLAVKKNQAKYEESTVLTVLDI